MTTALLLRRRAAVAAAARGWRVFPLRPNDKRPAVRDWETRATTDLDRIHHCWAAGPWNIGIACGPSGLVVIDLDTPKPGDTAPPAWQLPGVTCGEDVLAVLAERAGVPVPYDTHTVRTGRGGRHLYFTPPPRRATPEHRWPTRLARRHPRTRRLRRRRRQRRPHPPLRD
jgi:hypothetical protein